CHDEPTYRRTEITWAEQEAPVTRCNVCHDQSLTVDTQGYYWHVHARSIPARSNREQVRFCATCHSNEEVLAKFDLPNSTASYLASFHGKGMQLNDETTAGCLDCHVGAMENVHQIQSHEVAASATSAERVADTCRSPRCHPNAGTKVGSAAVHLDLQTSKGVEYFIAVIFVLLIIFTFGPSVMLTVLRMFQAVIGRYDQDDEQYHHRAEHLMKIPEGRQLLKRFNPFQRVQHWFLVVTFVALVLTGYPMKFADSALSAWFINLIGGLNVARIIHRIAGFLLLVGFMLHLCVYVTYHMKKERVRTGHNYFRIFYNLPMCINLHDFKRMGQYLLYLFF
ncbi:MAG: cytochrome b/b6 domain-containing protein, partial [Planctomycetes bacterium]|nr:cytochrome b/b6 domain-containing protein [Planctomycetota bacterium]